MLDEFDIESYKLKPLNKGLGFHESEPERLSTRSKFKTSLEKRLERENSLEGIDSLKAFYNMPVTDNKKVLKKKVPKKKEAEFFLQFFAWLLDLIFIGLIASMAILGMGLMAHIFDKTSLKMVVLTLTRINGLMGMGVLFTITYLLYFTYGDIATSLGKKIIGIKLVTKSGKNPTSRMTLVRSLVTVFSLAFLGIPMLFDFHGKLSNTKIVRV